MEDRREDKKRTRDDSEDDLENSPESTRFDSPYTKRPRLDSDLDSPAVKRIQEDFLDILEDLESVTDRDLDLDSVMKSFEEEILVPSPATAYLTPDSGDSAQPELGYLLEASDDELGLPPSFAVSSEEGGIRAVDFADPAGFGEMTGFGEEIPSYDSFEFGIGAEMESRSANNSGEFLSLGGLFDYSDESYEPAEIPEFLWRPESLSAL